MAKEFKEWDKRFSRIDLATECTRWLDRFNAIAAGNFVGEVPMKRWSIIVDKWDQDFVQYCVYKAIDAADWQLFRVSMKQCNTNEKLHMLLAYWHDNCYLHDSVESLRLNKCRIDNYLGALVRGGQLSSDGKYEVRK